MRLFATVCAVLCAGQTAAFAQDEDDWEFQHEAALNQTVAAVRYDAGVAIVAQCRDRALSTALIGMPAGMGGVEVQARRADGRTDTQAWVSGPGPGIYLSSLPARDIRFMRGGGLYSIRTADGAPRPLRTNFDLPTQSANLDRVLTACGWALTDDRDQLAVATGISIVNPEAVGRRRMPTRPGATTRAPRREIEPTPLPPSVPPPAENRVSCIVRDLHLRDCRADHAGSAENRDVQAVVSTNEGRQVYAVAGSDAAASEGKVVHMTGGRITVVDYISTIPAS